MEAEPGSVPKSRSAAFAQDVESARAVVLIVAAVAAIFWKELLRMLIALIVIAVGIGLFMLMQGVHS
jgi:multisubunit Na+/H+ antiporter MnhC subunit